MRLHLLCKVYELHLKAPRLLLLRASWRAFLLAVSDIIPPRVVECAPPPSPPFAACVGSSHRGAGPDCTRRNTLNINEAAHWLRVASVQLRDFCRLVGFSQYYFCGGASWVKVRKNVAEPQHWDRLNGGNAVSCQGEITNPSAVRSDTHR